MRKLVWSAPPGRWMSWAVARAFLFDLFLGDGVFASGLRRLFPAIL